MAISRRWWAFERGTLWVMDLAGISAPARSLPRIAAVFSEVQRESAGVLTVAMGLPDPALVLRRFAAGRRCFAAWVEGQIAAYGWVSWAVECIGELEREFHMLPGEAYIWDCATLPPYRRRGLYGALLSFMTAELRREGVQRIWIGSSLTNRFSIRGFARAGFHPVIRLLYVRLARLTFLWINRYPHAPDALVAAAQRALLAPHERAWGAFALGYREAIPLPACA